MAKCFPHVSHLCLEISGLEFTFALPSLYSMESTVKDLMETIDGDRDEEEDTETSEVAGESGGDKEHSLE